MQTVLELLFFALNILWWIIVVHAVMSWLIAFNVINTYNDFVRSIWIALEKLTEPVYRPIRRILPDMGALDLSPLVVLLLISAVQIVVRNNFY